METLIDLKILKLSPDNEILPWLTSCAFCSLWSQAPKKVSRCVAHIVKALQGGPHKVYVMGQEGPSATIQWVEWSSSYAGGPRSAPFDQTDTHSVGAPCCALGFWLCATFCQMEYLGNTGTLLGLFREIWEDRGGSWLTILFFFFLQLSLQSQSILSAESLAKVDLLP